MDRIFIVTKNIFSTSVWGMDRRRIVGKCPSFDDFLKESNGSSLSKLHGAWDRRPSPFDLLIIYPVASWEFKAMRLLSSVVLRWCSALLFVSSASTNERLSDNNPLVLPAPGDHQLRVLSPNLLELSLITTKAPDPAKVSQWDFVDSKGQAQLPKASEFIVRAGGQNIPVRTVGFKRRVLYAPLVRRDLRLGNYLYLQLARPVAEGQRVEVINPRPGSASLQFDTTMEPLRFSPVIHVNQTGYVPAFPKIAMVGYFLGSLGEMEVPAASSFKLIDVRTSAPVYHGKLTPRRDIGYEYAPVPYQKVLAADFTEFKTPGEYRLVVPGLGASFPFFIDDGAAAAVARAYALGLYHQRCGTSNALPFTRFTHGPCHTAAAEVPTAYHTNTLAFLAEITMDCTNNARHVAPQLKDFNSSLYPFLKQGKLDASGGHHDAGDYSKYTINSAALIHALVFAADALPGVGSLDNLGLPESGDGKSDLLQEAKWEADFLAKMQDDDGGFYFLVYPRDRKYENNVLPDQGDPQIVWPKNTAATAAAVAALAQCAASPLFKKQFPDAASLYLKTAKKGWTFLERAFARHGRDRAYQKITHYGDDFMHDDELAWAACELFLATGEEFFHKRLIASFDPANPATRRWGWWRLYESYGRAVRSYACAARSGKVRPAQLNQSFLSRCEAELAAGAHDQLRWSQQSAYGTSFPTETKRFRGGGWYFSMDQAFDLAAAGAPESPALNNSRPKFLEAILSNLNYMAGCNPVNVCHLTGLGWRRPREIVHHYAMNDRRILPPSGIPLGDVQAGFMWLDLYKKELGALSHPSDGGDDAPYPIYDRWGDSFNVQTEFVIVNQARALAAAAFLMAQTPLKDQSWKPLDATIEFRTSSPQSAAATDTVILRVPQRDLRDARIVWEAEGQEPRFGPTLPLTSPAQGPQWLEAEAQWPDGMRVFAVTNLQHRSVK